ncbi:hypothetical protein ACFQ5D_17775 [Paenibacillus farraposensis]|uniref:Uncharacterized protein n=1 Tax=Paenibacillus farraposensis TaxID=2807095 RepID=A0ABW4DH99_9BACL|nr:hypothetical protein [Paenibacillus farraposensis]MCC3378090.1 hypothetical protein [Paenibacillus farraposensis]
MRMYANQVVEYAVEMKLRKTNPMKDVTIPKREEEQLAEKQEERNY